MSNDTEVEEQHVPQRAEEAAPAQPLQMVSGEVRIVIDAQGGLQVSAPPNQLIALAIIEADKAFLTMQMQDGMRRAQASQPPRILKAGADALAKIARPS